MEKKRNEEGKRSGDRGVKGIDRKYFGGIKINSVPGNVCGW